jgi:flagellar hook protein FlgE
MLRSMFSAVSGLTSHQLRMDIIGNNIANVNTLAYKGSTGYFREGFLQISRGATENQPVGLAVGLGANLNTSTTKFTQGAFQRTDVASDLALTGDGYFMVADASTIPASPATTGTYTAAAGDSRFLTRAGNFLIDKDGFLRTQEGYYLVGTSTQPGVTLTTGIQDTVIRIPPFLTGGTEATANYTVGFDGTVTIVGEAGTTEVVGYIAVSKFENNNGLRQEGSGYYTVTEASGVNEYVRGGNAGAGNIQSGALELSNIDISTEFTNMIITQRGFDANARTITASDEMLQTVINIKR